jgi:hypothetical protein
MLLSWLRPRRERTTERRPSFRPRLESLDDRIVPANAHFVAGGTGAVIDTATGALTVTFKEAGLGNNQAVDVTLSGEAHAVYQWYNKGGNKPMGVPFNVDEAFSLSGTFYSDKNGNVTGSFTVYPPSVSEFLATHHAANWVPVMSVSYTDIVVTDTTNGVSTLDAGIFFPPLTTYFAPPEYVSP